MQRGLFGTLVLLIIIIALVIIAWPQIGPSLKSGGCQQLDNQIQNNLNQSNYCSQDSDCVSLNLGCQLSCFAFVNKNADSNVIGNLTTAYIDSSCKVCNELCIKPPEQSDLICRGGKCIDNRTAQ
jgi:hypothetical protein